MAGITISTTVFSLFILSLFLHSANGAATHKVLSYGAKADGTTDNSAAFLKAWPAVCGETGEGATMYVPSSKFLLHPTLFRGACKSKSVVIQIDGNLVASSDYKLYGAAGYWIKLKNVQGLTFQGGQLDAKDSALWECKAQKTDCPDGARIRVQKVTVKDVAFIGSTNGLRIKSWERSSNSYGKDIVFDGATMDNVKTPIIIDQHYCPHNIGCPNECNCALPSDQYGECAADVEGATCCEHAFGSASGTMVPSSCLQ